jgi:hypothetical protein
MGHIDDGTARSGRDDRGRFAQGNPGGPGRPRRAVESDYLRSLTDRVTPDVWASIVDAVVTAARSGDMRAVEWLTRYVLGNTPPTLFDLAVADAADVDVDAEITHVVGTARGDDFRRITADRDPVHMLGPHIGRR